MRRRLRALEAVSIATTTLAFAITVLLVTTGLATELNPVALELLDTGGWAFVGVLAIVLEAGTFAYLQRTQHELPRASLAGGAAIALVGVADLLLNLFLLSRTGIPLLGTFYAAKYIPPVALVLVAGVVAFARPDPRPVVTSFRENHRSRRVIAAAFALFLITSISIAPFGIGVEETSPIGTAKAAETVIEDFEDQSLDAVTNDGNAWKINNTQPREGSYHAYYNGSCGGGCDYERDFTSDTYNSVSWYVHVPSLPASGYTAIFDLRSGTTDAVETRINTDGSVEVRYGATTYDTGGDITPGEYYKFSIENISYANDQYDLRVYDSADNLAASYNGAGFQNSVSSLSRYGTRGYEAELHTDYYGTDGVTIGQSISGNVTDSDGNALDGATVQIQETGDTATTDASGAYSFSEISDGTYTVEATESGYTSETQTVEVAGADVTGVNFSLGNNLQGTVTKKKGGACQSCTVELWLMNDSNTTTDAGETIEEAQEETVETLSRAVPRDAFDPDLDALNAEQFTGDNAGRQVLVHPEGAWYEEADPIGPVQPKLGHPGSEDLERPLIQLEPDTEYTFSIADRSRDPSREGPVDSKIEPGVTDSGTVVLERVGPANDTITKKELETSPQVRTGLWDPDTPVVGGASKEHEYVTASLPEGYWRLRPKQGGVSYVIRVGNPEDVPRTIEPDLENAENQTAAIAQEVQDTIDAGEMKRVTVTTDANGTFSYAVPSGYSTVAITVFDGQRLTDGITNPSLNDLRSEIDRQDYNGSIYLSTSPTTVHPPATDVQITVSELKNPTLHDLGRYLDQLAWLEDLVNQESFSELEHLFTESLEGKTNQELLEARNRLRDTVLGNAELRDRFTELAAERGVPTDLIREDLSHSQLQAQIEVLQAALTSDQPTQDQDPMPGSDYTPPTVDTSPNVDVGGTTVNVEIPTGSQLNESDSSQSVVCQQPDGATRWVNSSNVSIDSGATGDTILVEDVIDNQTAGCNYIVMAPGDEEGVVREEVNVQNPAFDGEVPELASINLNTQRPGPSEEVVVGVTPAEMSSFNAIKGATVYGPDGSSLATSHQNGDVVFTTNGTGSHLVKLNVTDGERSYIESVRVKAGNSSVDYPASVRVHNGVLGRSVVASDGVESGRISVERGGSVARITAEVDGQSVPNELHVHARDLTGIQQEVTVAVVDASDGARVTKGSIVKLHMARLSDGAHVRVNGNPVTSDANQWGKVEHFSDSTLVTTNLRDGTVEVAANNNPGWIDTAGWWLDRGLQQLPNPLVIVPVEPVEPVATVGDAVKLGSPLAKLPIDAGLASPGLELVSQVALEAPDPATLGVPIEGVIA